MATVGRPTKFKEEYVNLVYNYCLLGATDKQLANYFDIDEATVNRWKEDYPEFCESIKKGKDQADAIIASKLYHRASGYSHPEDKIFISDGEPVIVPTVKHYPPDTAAAIFWLKNRKSDVWRDKVETEITGLNGGPIQVTNIQNLDDADLDKIIEIMAKAQPLLPE